MTNLRAVRTALLVVLIAGLSVDADAGTVVFSAGGDSTSASIQPTVDAFRAALGEPNNGNMSGPLISGRREINWDGGGSTTSSSAGTPFDAFLDTRGARFVTPGTGFTQATDDGLAGINPSYSTTFGFFSPLRMFTPTGSNITDALFFVPGTNGDVSATVGGFGAVFSDVDLVGSTSIQFFDVNDALLFSQSVEPGTVPDESLSFLGVVFDAGERVSRVRIATGNTALGPNDGSGVDVVVMDDVLYREPQAVPEPSTLLLLASALGGSGLVGFRRR
jgi:hypothetical protein